MSADDRSAAAAPDLLYPAAACLAATNQGHADQWKAPDSRNGRAEGATPRRSADAVVGRP